MHRIVNGVRVEMSAEEEAEFEAARQPGPTPVPPSVTMRQARLALLQAGMLDAVNAAIAALPGASGEAARIEWDYSSEVHRNRPLVLSLGPALGLSSETLDQLFITAATL